MAYNKKQALIANITALETAFRVKRENRPPTDTERLQMQQYSGFGGIRAILNNVDDLSRWPKSELPLVPAVTHLWSVIEQNAESIRQQRELKESLRNSVLTAFYTPQEFVNILGKALYKALGGAPERMLEPSAGSGRFLHLFDGMPGAENIKKTAYEKDLLTGMVLQGIERDTQVNVTGFENIPVSSQGSYDLVVSNIPFADVKVFDPTFHTSKDNNRRMAVNRLHTYFFVKGLDMVKDGGLVAYITSQAVAETDSNRGVREYMVQHADLVAGIRLVDNLFAEDGISSVGTDLLIFQRNDNKRELTENDRLFIETKDYQMLAVGDGIDTDATHARNQYFAQKFTIEDYREKKRSLGGPVSRTDQFGKDNVGWSDAYLNELFDDLDTWQKELEFYLDRDLSANVRKIEKPVVEQPQVTTDKALGEEVVSLYDLFGLSDEERTQIKTTGRRKKNRENKPVPGAVQDNRPEMGERWYKIADDTLRQHHKSGTTVNDSGQVGILVSKQDEHNNSRLSFCPLDKLSSREKDILHLYNAVRDAYWMLADKERDTQEPQQHDRDRLNDRYDKLIENFGSLRSAEVAAVCAMDANYEETATLERYENGQRIKADIFSEPVSIVTNDRLADNMTPHEALAASMNLNGYVDIEFIEERTGHAFDEVRKELYGEIYYNAAEKEWQHKGVIMADDIYYRIEQQQKALRMLQYEKEEGTSDKAALDASIEETRITIDAMEKAKPKLIEFEELDFNLGERWIPSAYYNGFFRDVVGINDFQVTYIEASDQFHISMGWDYKVNQEWKVTGKGNGMEAEELFRAAMVNQVPDLAYSSYDPDKGKYVPVPDTDAMQMAAAKIERLQNGFVDWLNKLPVQEKDALTTEYNRRFNCYVRPAYDGSHQTFPGLTFEKFDYNDLYPSQKDAIWMLKQNGGGICDHEVGAGKTMIMCVTAMEMKRLGLANKPLIIGLKANVHEIAATFRKAYPDAKLLYPGKEDFKPDKRHELFRNIANNNYDCIILTHDQFNMIPQSFETQHMIFQQELENVEDSLRVLEQQTKRWASRRMEAGLEKRKQNLQSKLKELEHDIALHKDITVDFRTMGIDHIFVDESHQYKNLMFQTRQNRVAGLGNTKGSQRAMNLFVAIRDIQRRKGTDLGATFLSGTTISNSLTELYVLFKYLRPKALERQRINCFDAWSAIFTRKSTEFEFNVTNQVVQKERMRYFVKVPELAQFYNQITDYRTADMIGIDRPQKNAVFYNIPPSPDQEEYIKKLMQFAQSGNGELLGLGRLDDAKTKAKMLIATNCSNKMALDMRLVDPYKYENTSDGKVDRAAAKIAEYYNRFNEQKGTQFVFSDLGTYKSGEWNVYSAIKDKLVNDYGIPPAEIRFIQECTTEKRRKDVIDAMNEGKVRVLFGSTSMLGTGVNAQQRAVALHHLDAPWRPSDLEQREGRVIRKGNRIAKEFADNKVDIITYATERSLDAYKFNLLHNKQMFISQLKSQQLGSRSLDEGALDESTGVPFAEYVAILSGNTDLLDKAKLDKQIKQLERERILYQRETSHLERDVYYLKEKIKDTEKNIACLQKDYAFYNQRKKAGDGFVTNAGVMLTGEECGRFLNGCKGTVSSGDMKKVGTYCGMTVVAKVPGGAANGTRFELQSSLTDHIYTRDSGVFPIRLAEGEAWLQSIPDSFPARIGNLQSIIEKDRGRIVDTENMIAGRCWDKEDRLADLKNQAAILDERIRKTLEEKNRSQSEDLKEDAEDAVVVEEPQVQETQQMVQEAESVTEKPRLPEEDKRFYAKYIPACDVGPVKRLMLYTDLADGGNYFRAEIDGKEVVRAVDFQHCLQLKRGKDLGQLVEQVFGDALPEKTVGQPGQPVTGGGEEEETTEEEDIVEDTVTNPYIKNVQVTRVGPGQFSISADIVGKPYLKDLDKIQAQRYYIGEMTADELAVEVFKTELVAAARGRVQETAPARSKVGHAYDEAKLANMAAEGDMVMLTDKSTAEEVLVFYSRFLDTMVKICPEGNDRQPVYVGTVREVKLVPNLFPRTNGELKPIAKMFIADNHGRGNYFNCSWEEQKCILPVTPEEAERLGEPQAQDMPRGMRR